MCSLQITGGQKLINCKGSKVAKNSDFSLIILGKDREFFKVLSLQMLGNFRSKKILNNDSVQLHGNRVYLVCMTDSRLQNVRNIIVLNQYGLMDQCHNEETEPSYGDVYKFAASTTHHLILPRQGALIKKAEKYLVPHP